MIYPLTILRTVFGMEAETRILPLAFAPLKRLKPSFCRWQFKTVQTVDQVKDSRFSNVQRALLR